MQVSPEIEGERTGDFTLISNIELQKSDFDPRKITGSQEKMKEEWRYINGYIDLSGSIEIISNALRSNLESGGKRRLPPFAKATIYKSLGPKDLTIIVEGASLPVLYEIIDRVIGCDQRVNRTFSIFATRSKEGRLDPEISVVSFLRVGKNSRDPEKLEDIFSILMEDGTNNAYETTGVMDIVIKWKGISSTEELFKRYDWLMCYITDYQTKIDRRVREVRRRGCGKDK